MATGVVLASIGVGFGVFVGVPAVLFAAPPGRLRTRLRPSSPGPWRVIQILADFGRRGTRPGRTCFHESLNLIIRAAYV